MTKSRLEAFSDGVLAIIITIMVLELKVPHGADFTALRALAPVFFSYVLSFVVVGIYWNNHHHLLQMAHGVNGAILWANLHLLFWLSLLPFGSAWMGENAFATGPVAFYGVILVMSALAYSILVRALIARDDPESPLAQAVGRDFKGNLSVVIYAVALPLAFVERYLALGLYVTVTLLWLIPDRRIENVAAQAQESL